MCGVPEWDHAVQAVRSMKNPAPRAVDTNAAERPGFTRVYRYMKASNLRFKSMCYLFDCECSSIA